MHTTIPSSPLNVRSIGKKARCSWHQHILLGSHAQGWWVGLFTCPARQGILRPMISWYQSRRSRFLMATHYSAVIWLIIVHKFPTYLYTISPLYQLRRPPVLHTPSYNLGVLPTSLDHCAPAEVRLSHANLKTVMSFLLE